MSLQTAPDSPRPLARLDAGALAHFDAALARRVSARELAGVVAVLSWGHADRAVLSHGFADIGRATPMTAETPMRVYSMSKPICAALTLVLCERGLLTLDTPVADFIPALARLAVLDKNAERKASGRAVTVRHLLTHTAGFVYPNPRGSVAEQLAATAIGASHGEVSDLTLAEYVERLAIAPLAHEPGTAFSYSVAMDVLARVAELATGRRFDTLLREVLFEPLGMRDTGFCADPARAAHIYGKRSEDQELTPLWPQVMASREIPRLLSGGGGIISTATDYTRFCDMLRGGGALEGVRILTPESVRSLHVCHVPALPEAPGLAHAGPECGAGCAYGFGVRVVVQAGDYGEVGAFGWDGLAGTTFFVDPACGFSAVLMTQIAPWPARLHAEFRAHAYGALGFAALART